MILDEKIMGALVGQMQEQCYVFVHDKDRLSSFFEEDADLVKRRNDLTRKKERLSKANAAMANIQVDRNLAGNVMFSRPRPCWLKGPTTREETVFQVVVL